MGPPQRPTADNRPANVNEFADVLIGSGVDEKEEEAALMSQRNLESSQRNYESSQRANGLSFASNLDASFGAGGAQPPYFGGQPGYHARADNAPGGRASFYGAGILNQPAVTLEEAEAQAARTQRREVRRHKEMEQYHMRDPFLLGGVLFQRLGARTKGMQVTMPDRQSVREARHRDPVRMNVVGPDGHDNIVELRGQNLLYAQSPMTELCALLSLAAEERVRTVVEDAATLAQGRRKSAHGVVPPDLIGLAVGKGTPEETAIRPSSSGSSKKRMYLLLSRVFSPY